MNLTPFFLKFEIPGTIGEYNGNIQLSHGCTEVFNGNEFEFTQPDGTKYHFVNGKLVWMQDRQNHQLTIDLDHTGTDGVQHSSGPSATMTRNSHGQIEALYSPKYPRMVKKLIWLKEKCFHMKTGDGK